MKLAEGNRVLWLDPETNREFKATIERIFKVKARITLTDLTTKSVALEELELAPLPVRTRSQTSIPSMSSISTRDIEPHARADLEKSSISTRDIELFDVAIKPESSIRARDIEPIGFNIYSKHKKGKTYQYWRYSYRTGKTMNHIHIGKIDRVIELRGKPRGEVLALLGRL